MPIITPGHRNLLDVLAQFACCVAMATTKEPHEDLKDVLRTLQHMDASDLSHRRSYISNSCASGLVFAARYEQDLFPKPFARAIVHKLEPLQLWNIACDVDGLDVEGIEVACITNDRDGRCDLWERLGARTSNATDLFIAPQVFTRVLEAYEEQVEETRRQDHADM
jgi:hypothetical protein